MKKQALGRIKVYVLLAMLALAALPTPAAAAPSALDETVKVQIGAARFEEAEGPPHQMLELSLAAQDQPSQIVVDGSGHTHGPLPIISYALTEPAGADIYPLGNGSYALFGLYDSGSTKVRISGVLPNRVGGSNWGKSDTEHLNFAKVETVNVRLNGLNAQSPLGYIPIGQPGSGHGPQVEVKNISVGPESVDVTLIGAPVVNQIVAHIDYTEMIADPNTGVRAPYIDFYWPGDPVIPVPDVTLQLEPFGNLVSTDGETPGQRYWLRGVVVQRGGNAVSDQQREYDFLFDTGTTLTIVGDRVANGLDLSAAPASFDCYGGTGNGYVLDAVTMAGISGSYQVNAAAVCWANDEVKTGDAVIGANFFDQVQIVLDGPNHVLGVKRAAPAQPGLSSDPSAGANSRDVVQFAVSNESATPICYAYMTSVAYGGVTAERLSGAQISPGATQQLTLAPGVYEVTLKNCDDQAIFYRNYVEVLPDSALHITDADVRAAACSGPQVAGRQLYGSGSYAEALEQFQAARDCFQSVPYLFGAGEALNNMAAVHERQGRYAEALDLFHHAQAIAHEVGNRDGESAALNGIAAIASRLGRSEEALDALEKVLAIRRGLRDYAGEAVILENMAIIYSKLGRHDEAQKWYAYVGEMRRNSGDRRGQANTLNNLAQDYVRQGRYEEALAAFEQALAILEAPEARNLYIRAAAQGGIGGVYARQGKLEAALAAYQQALATHREIGDRAGEISRLASSAHVLENLGRVEEALRTYADALDALEDVRALAGGEVERASFAGEHESIYQNAIDLHYRVGHYQEAFQIAERARARAFLDLIGNQRVDFREGAAPELIERQQALLQQIANIQSGLAQEHNKPLDQQGPEVIEELAAELEGAAAEYATLLRQLKVESPEYASLVSINTLTLTEVQSQVLDEHTTLIEYFVMDDQTLAWVIDREGFELVRLDITRDELANQVEFLRKLIARRDFDAQASAALYDALFAPLAPHIDHANLIIVPHGVLHYLPFAALWNAGAAHYLIENYGLTYAPSASALKYVLDKRNPDEGRVLALGDPDGSLLNARNEATAIAALYGAAPLLGPQAMESRVKAAAGQLDELHLAAHGVYNPFNSLFTCIELAAGEGEDGNLEVHEVYGLDLTGTNLVVLSACQTVLGEQSAGDELVGLTRAFLYAGTPAVVTTLWSIDDAASEALMEAFYGHLREGLTNAEALRAAQLEVLAQELWQTPYYWAAFSLTGDYRGSGQPGPLLQRADEPTPATAVTQTSAETPATEVSPTPTAAGRRICGAAVLPVGLVILAVVRRRRVVHDWIS
jgi:CHAT domain-containing protein/Tfp pilus assembly protein PilF